MQMITFMLFFYMLTLTLTQTTGCNSSEWTCTTGQCIDIGHRCDGNDQCTDTSDEANCNCVDKQINLLIAVEEGRSEYIQPFIKDFLKDVAVDGRNVIVRFVLYNDSNVLVFNNTEMSSKVKTIQAVDELKWAGSDNAEFKSIINFVASFSTLDFGAHRQSSRNILFLIIFKLNRYNSFNFQILSNTIQGRGIRIVALGVALTDNSLLDSIVSKPTENNKFAVDNFQDLNRIIPKLTSELCPKETLAETVSPTSLTSTAMSDEKTGSKEKLIENFSPTAVTSITIPDTTKSSNFSKTDLTLTTVNDTIARSCDSLEWTCTSGQCIDIGHRCDGTDQCTDKSDERKCYCDDKPINLLFAIDDGETEDINNIIKDFIKNFLRDLAVDGKNVIVWFLKYKDTVILAFNRTEVNKVKTLKAVDELKWEPSPYAEFRNIVSYVSSISTTLYFGAHRQKARNILLLITLYLTKHNYKNFAAVANIIQEKGLHIIAVGVELQDNLYLRYVASEPVENNTFAVDSSDDLNKIIPSLTSALCQGNSSNEFTDNFTQTFLASTTLPDETTRTSTLVSTASGSADNTILIVSLLVITILLLAIVAYKFKEKLRCCSRNTRISTISSENQDYVDVDHYDYLEHYELKTEDPSKTQDKNTDYHDLLDYDKYDHYNDVYKQETYMGVGNDKEMHPEDHYDNLDNKIEMVSEYITPKEIVYNSTAVSDYDKLEQSRGEEHIYGRPRSTGDFTQRPELPAFTKDVKGKPRRGTL
ncbi:uncharacterized protein LOC106059789 isoform X2 [Biomphalaria glabrata]|uniref:Uncharacterized protein LOC106059789 isoform X2 n=1 Tax=Biomphalaria glabrata TaxID=6526 RepID=A0A9W2Z4X9_BIOGL|nr:uncharacterized protein LOC106059789 isoform X2 [Biomphalaria glabrata]KAI8739025.1 putative vitellogenin receptor isoform X3 [Biomphalaria glabrata]